MARFHNWIHVPESDGTHTYASSRFETPSCTPDIALIPGCPVVTQHLLAMISDRSIGCFGRLTAAPGQSNSDNALSEHRSRAYYNTGKGARIDVLIITPLHPYEGIEWQIEL